MRTNYLLAISGNDILSGGGLYADLATYTANSLHGFVAVTCLTTVSDGKLDIFPIEDSLVKKQLESLENVPFSAIKIGLLPNRQIAKEVLEFIKKRPLTKLVLDPVLVCKENKDASGHAVRDDLIDLLPYATIITPNLIEAELLSQKSIKTLEDMQEAAAILHRLGAKSVLIKGGNRFSSQRAIDLFYDGIDYHVLEHAVLDANNIGAGCTLASSIASHLALGKPLLESVTIAKNFVYEAILHSDQYGVKQYYEK
ncbi:bifunctional hydroxymethylpyrimidine kinase/phosphomethylpyrimidine kinase [Streptococcus phocae subsp. salmonis]|uniref:bifunctional hydroxymethylpyrimidine kinase/phosphomethylpyrimidine kinase n=1 Tax=Streptococcus phocae TaxID=119224 RepID=UPI00053203D5|nr:bifunctional hydroxymethylpyrimidine kinase/phosphomethylpyrimidine kinase [Streptococcus phocae]KGR73478.1 phosphomethylpyrimidine kinase [Streptococcus phocae subsp. salmonis]